jgi:hypothetical protein
VREALIEVTQNLVGRLYSRPGVLRDFIRSRAAPSLYQRCGHLDMALHAEVLAERERWIRAVRTRKQ